MNKLGVAVSLNFGYHPQFNGQVERANQEIGGFLWLYCSENWKDWAQLLPWTEYAQNSLWHSATQLILFHCILGYQPPLFPWDASPTDVPAVDEWFKHSEQLWEKVHQ